MDTKTLIKKLLKRCKLCLLVLLFNLLVIYTFDKLRLGRLFSDSQKNVISSLPSHIKDCVKHSYSIFKTDNLDQLSSLIKGEKHYLGYYDTVRYAYIVSGNNLTIIIRGSATEENWLDNLNTSIESSTTYGKANKAYTEITEGIYKQLSNNLDLTTFDKITVTGGSLGGALSVLLGRVIYEVNSNCHVVAICSPKVTSSDYKVPVTHLRHEQDPVTYLPVWDMFRRYDHDGETYLIRRDGSLEHYENSFKTDLKLSLLNLREPLDPSVHSRYMEFI